jgi:MFS family permease
VRGYLDILRSSAGILFAVTGAARLAWGIVGLALIFHVEDAAGSFAAAGLAVGALSLTSAALAPLRGTLIDAHARPAMLALSLATALVLLAIAISPPAGPDALSYVILAGLAGAVAPPFTAWTRVALAERMEGVRLRRAYALDNILEESSLVAGPLVAAIAIAIATPSLALAVAAGLAALGGIALTTGSLARDWTPPTRRRTGAPSALNRRLAIAFASMAGMGAGLGLFEVAVAAFAVDADSPGSAGLVFAALSAAGMVGAAVYGSRSWPGSTARQYAVLLAYFGAGLAVLAVAGSLPWLVALTAIAGLTLTPVFVASSLLIEELSPVGPAAVAFAWVTTACNGGVAAGAAVGGAMVDAHGTEPAFLSAGGIVLLAALGAGALIGTARVASTAVSR